MLLTGPSAFYDSKQEEAFFPPLPPGLLSQGNSGINGITEKNFSLQTKKKATAKTKEPPKLSDRFRSETRANGPAFTE